jgi:hypothetical protein
MGLPGTMANCPASTNVRQGVFGRWPAEPAPVRGTQNLQKITGPAPWFPGCSEICGASTLVGMSAPSVLPTTATRYAHGSVHLYFGLRTAVDTTGRA